MTTHPEPITLDVGGDLLVVAPARGGMITHWVVQGEERLFLDDASFADLTKNVRGGNPVLFPSPGPLADGAFRWGGREGRMPQHGLARQRPWTVVDRSKNAVTVELRSDDATRAAFPWDFTVRIRYVLEGSSVRIEQHYQNDSDAPMPLAAGFHPYFRVPEALKSEARIATPATRAWDNVRKEEIRLGGPIDLGAGEVDLHLVDHGGTTASLTFGDVEVRVSASAEFGRWVVWTLPGKDFVCLEPWTTAANALNTGEGLLVVAPGERRSMWSSFAAGRKR